jgi:pimeloyl-ACP methyl ester carboxylesterase
MAEVPVAASRADHRRPALAARRATWVATAVGTALAAPFYLWALLDLFSGSVSLTRSESPSSTYTLQAQAMIHGHLWVRPGSLGIEGFVVHGHTYSYFGILPSLLRIPILLIRGKLSDVVSPEGVERFLTTVPHAQFVELSDAGHTAAGDDNDAFSDAVVDFVTH